MLDQTNPLLSLLQGKAAFWSILIYLVLMIGLSAFLSRFVRTQNDYFLASRKLGPWAVSFSLFATWFGAESCMGTAGKVYREGLWGAHADPLAYGFCLLLLGIFFARKLWDQNFSTLPELFRKRFGPRVEILSTLIMIPSSLFWASAQLRAFGEILQTTGHFSLPVGIFLAVLIVLSYIVFGGLLADATMDLIQGFILILGLSVLFWSVWAHLPTGGVEFSLGSVRPWAHSSLGQKDFWGKFELLLVPLFGSLMSQELVTRVCAARSASTAQKSAFVASGLYFVMGSIPVLLGLFSITLFPSLEVTDQVLPMLSQKYLSPGMQLLFLGSLVAAILSTIDTTLLSVSALVTQNLFSRLGQKSHSVFFARMVTVVSALFAYYLALQGTSVSSLVEIASSLGGPLVLILTIVALLSKKSSFSQNSILLALSLGVFFHVFCEFFWKSFSAPTLGSMAVMIISLVLLKRA